MVDRRSATRALAGGALAAAFGGATLTASCAPDRADGSRHVLRVGWGSEPTDLVPLTTSAGPSQFVGSKLFDGLLTYDYDLKPMPQLARAWEISPDGLRYSFTLRDGVRFSDGEPLTSADVAFSIAALKKQHPRGRTTFASLVRIETPDARTVILHLSQPAPFLIFALASAESPIVPKHVFAGLPTGARVPTDRLVASGPFVMKEWVYGSYMLLERNPRYWDAPRPFLDQIILTFIKDPSARAAALEAGEIDLLPEDLMQLSDVARFKAMPQVTIDRGPYRYYGSIQEGLSFNLENRYLRDVHVRQAIAHAIDVDALTRKLYFGYAIPSPTAITPYQKAFFDPAIPAPTYDLALGNRLLDAAGYSRGADGQRFGLRLTWNTGGGLPPQAPMFYREALAGLGIDATIRTVDFATYTRLIFTERAWDISVDRYGSAFDPTVGVQRWYYSKSFKIGVPFANPAHYDNPEADRLWDAAAAEPDPQRRAELFRQLQRALARDIPILPQIVPDRIIAARRDVRGYAPGATGTMNNFAQVHFDPPRLSRG